MTSRNRVITLMIFTQIVALFGVLVWLWIRRYSREGVIVTPRVEIDLTRGNPAAKTHSEPAAKVVLPTEAQLEAKSARDQRRPVRQDDLQRIEGIGPKISAVLHEAGINTFKQLARAKGERLKNILDEAGIPLADPTTWPEQAALAAEGDWLALADLKAQLKGGRRTD